MMNNFILIQLIKIDATLCKSSLFSHFLDRKFDEKRIAPIEIQ